MKYRDINDLIKEGTIVDLRGTVLDISFEKLTSLAGIEKLMNLICLRCDDNQLTSLEGIGGLVNLKELICNDNKLTSLEGIEGLTNLEELICHTNKLTSLKGIEGLTNLEFLDCSYNKLTNLKGLENLTKLNQLRYHYNPCTINYEGLDEHTLLDAQEAVKKVWLEVNLSKPEFEGAKDCYDSGLFDFKVN